MRMEHIKEKIRNYIAKFYRNSCINDEDNIFDLGIVNSLFTMQLITYIENEFDISLNNDDFSIENFDSILSISALISKKIQRVN